MEILFDLRTRADWAGFIGVVNQSLELTLDR